MLDDRLQATEPFITIRLSKPGIARQSVLKALDSTFRLGPPPRPRTASHKWTPESRNYFKNNQYLGNESIFHLKRVLAVFVRAVDAPGVGADAACH